MQEGTLAGSRGFQTSGAAHQQPVSAPEMIEVFVNDQPLQIPKGSTVMAACDAAGIDIPRRASPAHSSWSQKYWTKMLSHPWGRTYTAEESIAHCVSKIRAKLMCLSCRSSLLLSLYSTLLEPVSTILSFAIVHGKFVSCRWAVGSAIIKGFPLLGIAGCVWLRCVLLNLSAKFLKSASANGRHIEQQEVSWILLSHDLTNIAASQNGQPFV